MRPDPLPLPAAVTPVQETVTAGLAVDLRLANPVALAARFSLRGFTVLLGASGEGKSSLLKALAGLLPATGEPFAGLPPHRRPVGYLPQGSALFPHLSVWRNVAYGLDGRRSERRAAALAWLDRFGLGALADRDPSQLSGGQKQRVALLRALARRPSLLLLDEPTASLDAANAEAVMAELIARSREFGVPALAATHDALLAAMADHVAVMHSRRVVQEGPPETVFAAPVDPRAAALLGWRNLFSGVLDPAEGSGTLLAWPAAGAALRLRGQPLARPGAALAWGIPAGAVKMLPPGPLPLSAPAVGDGRESRIGGEVVARHVLSDRTVCVVCCGDAEVTVSLPPNSGARPGEAVMLAFPAEAIRVWTGA